MIPISCNQREACQHQDLDVMFVTTVTVEDILGGMFVLKELLRKSYCIKYLKRFYIEEYMNT